MGSRNLSGGLKLCAAIVSCAMIASLGAGFQYSEVNADAAGQTVFIPGDVSLDGKINVLDLCSMKGAYLDNSVSGSKHLEYDVTGDNFFDLSDIKTLQDYLHGKIDKFSENSNRYLAVIASVNSGVSETTNAGSSIGTYINLDNQIGSSITWTINVPEDGNYKLTFRNANGGADDRPMSLNISGSEETWRVSFPSTGSWTEWSESSVVVPFTKGVQTITLTSITANGGPNLDYLQLEKTDAEITPPEEVIPEGAKQVEALNRGLIAANTGSGMFISWRSLATDKAGTTFKLYKNGSMLSEFGSDAATNYMDNGGTSTDIYTIDTYVNGTKTGETEQAMVLANKNGGQSGAYFDIPLDVPSDLTMPDGTTCSYSPNDASVGDVDGDGEYEIILKWDPSNSQDNSKDGYTGNVYFDCYKLSGKKLWRIDLGINIRAGAHYTQFMVYDYDGDGKAEIVCKTADGSTDGQGNVIGDASKDYRSSTGRILTGPEYLSLFDGETGKVLDTVYYKPGRGTVSNWGDGYGNRVDRFVAATAYLNGSTPSVIMGRGYYTRMALTAYDVV
ncbi:MAG: carbohydrate-binding protein, partial [Ruminococcus sp.]